MIKASQSKSTSLKIKRVGEQQYPVMYRPGTTDENVIKEVIDNHCYRRVRLDFDVEDGEKWLDLGANIGTFAVYCKLRGATAICYEPDADCFKLLSYNAKGFECVNSAVTAEDNEFITFYPSKGSDNYRGSIFDRNRTDGIQVPNTFVGSLQENFYDGIKLDIEGSELAILDQQLLPSCNKCVMEYHTSRDGSWRALQKRIEYLREVFDHVQYPAELDRKIVAKQEGKTYFDRFVFCWNSKSS